MEQAVEPMDIDEYDLYTAGAEGQDSGTTLNDMMHLNFTMDRTHNSDSLSEKDIYTAGYERPQPSAPLDVAKFIIKVDWREPFPERWRATLQKALQSCFLKMEGKTDVVSLKLMDDPSCAEVQITPSRALEVLKRLNRISLRFKDYKDGTFKEATAWIGLDEAHFVKDNGAPSTKVIGSMPVTAASEYTNDVDDVSASNRASNKAESSKTAITTPDTPAVLTVPLYEFWYMHHAYRRELEQFEKQHGVSICAEVSVSIKHIQRSSPDSVPKTTDDFEKLVQECVGSFSHAAINHNHMNSDIVKHALRFIQSEEAKMMFTMSASDCLFFGPKKYTDVIKRDEEGTRMESQFNDKSSQMNKENRSLFNMDTKDLPTHLEMDTVHWDLMKLSYKEQLSQLETKYGVSFNEEKQQKNVTIKVQAQSKGVQHINLESHAIRALTQLYQKLGSAAVTCELKNPTDATLVASEVEKLQQEHHCVVAEDALSRWRLVGLPEHLGPAIAEIEKMLQKSVFDDKKKKSIGYSEDVPHARGIQWNQMPDYGEGAVGGSVREEGMNFKGRSEADKGFIDDLKKKSRKYEFCRDCGSKKSMGSICPVCKEVYGKLEGNQPIGKMKATKTGMSLPGYPGCGTIEIYYDIPDGVQTKQHPNPGKPFYGSNLHAYLPDNPEGKEVLSLLHRAFKQKLIFTVGRSTTTGADNVVTCNDIHHKTNISGGPESNGYPDPGYLKRVKDELKAKGIK
ncbi:E3 ubiquitin-protein ligase DTX3L-like [Rhinichthys klamathensis goyatoka]|uniref:E3 ubiquitin-protein ligase DTX3L-like n=1 Tax=Rhinichthys klamathensis goyatoka TaxID=3034132 RepID=UPI0024B4848B|nr:E3 ubiquitin-protein ligase DTX3L-like [Rhinichthys klamathensis goyatoka]